MCGIVNFVSESTFQLHVKKKRFFNFRYKFGYVQSNGCSREKSFRSNIFFFNFKRSCLKVATPTQFTPVKFHEKSYLNATRVSDQTKTLFSTVFDVIITKKNLGL